MPLFISALLASGAIPSRAHAERVIHEYILPPSKAESARWVKERRLPETIQTEDERALRQPSFDRATEAPVVGRDAATARHSTITPDRTTTHDGQLRYGATFNPSVVPFKRVTAADQVRANFQLGVRDGGLRPLALSHRAIPPDRDAFWGTIQLQARAGEALPIPSVAPSAAIISYRVQPKAQLHFFRDSADNFWVKSDRSGLLSVVFLTDAPRSYFSPQIPVLLEATDIPRQLRPRLAPGAQAAARRVLEHIGVRRGPLGRQLSRLVAYFRNFKAAPLQRASDNIYLDIALSQRGVCRHRSLAFVITAQAIGIPARYVENEAHAFVEVYLPRHGWARIDLGGASVGLDVQAARDKALHRAKQDPFPRPSRFEGGYSQLRGPVSGLAQRRPKPDQKRRRPRYSLRRFDRSSRTPVEQGRGQGATAGAEGPEAGGPRSGKPGEASAAAAEALPPSRRSMPAQKPTQIVVFNSNKTLYRGEALHIWGSVRAAKSGVSNLRVEIYLGRDRDSALLLGATTTDRGGAFLLRPSVPVDIEVGRYRIYAATPGDARHEASLSR